MTLFKKKKETPTFLLLLENAYLRAKNNQKKCFYYAIFENEKQLAENFCKKIIYICL